MIEVFPFEEFSKLDIAIIDACNTYMHYLETKLPKRFNNWYITKNVEGLTSFNTIVVNKNRYGMDPSKRDIYINIKGFVGPIIPKYVSNIERDTSKYAYDASDYDGINEHTKLLNLTDDMFKRLNELTNWNDGIISSIIYVCTHEWMHSIVMIDDIMARNDTHYLWQMEYVTDINTLTFLRQNEKEINELVIYPLFDNCKLNIPYIQFLTLENRDLYWTSEPSVFGT